ncbi:unnamed protein product [Dicrocoelium dendriticum]|nr:unnamed protein product [Dicrocoelium dendriticum]
MLPMTRIAMLMMVAIVSSICAATTQEPTTNAAAKSTEAHGAEQDEQHERWVMVSHQELKELLGNLSSLVNATHLDLFENGTLAVVPTEHNEAMTEGGSEN